MINVKHERGVLHDSLQGREGQVDHGLFLWLDGKDSRFQFELLHEPGIIIRHAQFEHKRNLWDILDLDQFLVVEVERHFAEVDAVHVKLEGRCYHIAFEVQCNLLVGVLEHPIKHLIEFTQAVADERHVYLVFLFHPQHPVRLREL